MKTLKWRSTEGDETSRVLNSIVRNVQRAKCQGAKCPVTSPSKFQQHRQSTASHAERRHSSKRLT